MKQKNQINLKKLTIDRRTKKLLKESFIELMSEKQIKDITVKDLTEHASKKVANKTEDLMEKAKDFVDNINHPNNHLEQ